MARLSVLPWVSALALALAACTPETAPSEVLDQNSPEGQRLDPSLSERVFQAPALPASEVPCIDVDSDGYGRGCALGPDCDDFDAVRAADCGAPLAPTLAHAPIAPSLDRAVALPPGDECATGTQRDCYSNPTPGPTLLDATCGHGLSACISGRWTVCAIDTHFIIPRAAITGALITGPTPCNPCDPECFTSGDYPTMPDLTAGDSSGVVYSGTLGGITLPASMGGGPLTDTDGDGVPDVADCAPANPAVNCTTEVGGIYHTLAYGTTAPPDSLNIMTTVRTADVYFLMDTTGSMGGAIANLKGSLTSTIIPNISTTIPDAWFGVGHHDDVPCAAFGTWGVSFGPLHHDWAFEHMLDVTSSAAAAQTAVNGLYLGDGYDLPESQLPALWAVASGGANFGSNPARVGCAAGTRGYPCFRNGTIPIIILFTDAAYHNGPGGYAPYNPSLGLPTYATTVAALNAIGAKVIVVYNGPTVDTALVGIGCAFSGGCGSYSVCTGTRGDAYAHARALCTATGSVDSSGNPLVYPIAANGTGLTTAVTTAIANLANYSRMDITLRVNDDPTTPAVDERGFVQAIATVATAASTTRCTATLGTWFQQCLPGTAVQFRVTLGNSIVMPTAVPQVFHFTIDELGNGTYVLGTTPVTIVVPAMVPTYPVSGTFWQDYDSTTRCSGTEVPRWGTLSWTATYPAGTQITWQAQTASSAASVAAAPVVSWIAPATASPVNVGDKLVLAGQSPSLPFLRITSVLQSSADRLRAPVLSGFDLTYACIPGM